MRQLIAFLAVFLTACGGGSPIPYCNAPAPRLANLAISPESAIVNSFEGQASVNVSWEVLIPEDAGVLSTVTVFDSNGVELDSVLADSYATSTTVPISTATAARYEVQVYNLGVCFEESNILKGAFEIVEVANVRGDYSAISGVILGSLSFDVTQIDLLTVAYGFTSTQAAFDVVFKDENGDGFLDVQFEIALEGTGDDCCGFDMLVHGITYSGTKFAAAVGGGKEQ